MNDFDRLFDLLECALDRLSRMTECHEQGLSWSREKWAAVTREVRDDVEQAEEEARSLALVYDLQPEPETNDGREHASPAL